MIRRSGLLIYDRLSESVHVDTSFREIVSCGNVWNDSDSKCLNLKCCFRNAVGVYPVCHFFVIALSCLVLLL
jgi:hypothetical protein